VCARSWTGNSANSYIASDVSIRVSKIVNQNDGLKPFWTPPIVTQLPSNATVGDQVVYAADATNGVYWSLYYDGIGTYPWKFVGGGPLSNTTAGGNNSRGSYGAITTGPSVTVPFAGDYEVEFSADCANNSSGNAASGFIALSVGGTEDTTTLRAGYLCGSVLNFGQGVYRKNPSKTLAASDVLTLESYSSGAINTNILYPSISIRPIRVSA